MKYLAATMVGIWMMVAGYFLFSGLYSPAWEGDSLAYHLPIAQMVTEGSWMDNGNFKLPYYYYPAMGEVLLSGWAGLSLPVNLYNLAGWVLLTLMVYLAGLKSGLNKYSACTVSVAVSLWPSVVRLIGTQTVDIWLAVWWLAALKVIAFPRGNPIWIGIYLGILLGTKYSGLPFAVILIGAFWDRWKLMSWRQNLTWIFPLIGIGGFWYIRNLLLTGNPVFPAHIELLGWQGRPELVLFTGNPLTTLLSTPGKFLEAMVSEYLIWILVLFLPIVKRSRWAIIGWLNLAVYLMLPSRPENIISDLRYIYPAMIPLAIESWKWLSERIKPELLSVVAVVYAIVELTQLDFHPKLYLMVGLLFIPVLVLYEQHTKLDNTCE